MDFIVGFFACFFEFSDFDGYLFSFVAYIVEFGEVKRHSLSKPIKSSSHLEAFGVAAFCQVVFYKFGTLPDSLISNIAGRRKLVPYESSYLTLRREKKLKYS